MVIHVENAVLHTVDHRTGTQEEQSLKESMRDQVESRGHIRADSQGSDHITQLRNRGISQYPLDIVLRHGDCGCKQGGERPNKGHQHHRRGEVPMFSTRREQRIHADDHIHTRRNHGGGMDHSRNRSRAFHGIWQPNMQRPLGRLPDGADYQQDTNQPGSREAQKARGSLCQIMQGLERKNLLKAEGIGHRIEIDNPQKHEDIAHAGCQESFDRCRSRRGFGEPKTDQQVRAQTHDFPTDEQGQQVVG